MGGRPSGPAQVADGVTLPAGGTAAVALPLRIAWADVPGFLAALGAQQPLAFRVIGAAAVPYGPSALEAPFAAEGSLVLPQPPGVAFSQAAVTESSLFTTTVELRFQVSNPNPFPLPTGRLSFDLRVGGVSVASAAKSELAPVAAGGTASVAVPVRVSAVGAAAGFLNAALHASPDVVVTGRAGYGALEVALDSRALLAR